MAGRKKQRSGTRKSTGEKASGVSEEIRQKAREGRATENRCRGRVKAVQVSECEDLEEAWDQDVPRDVPRRVA